MFFINAPSKFWENGGLGKNLFCFCLFLLPLFRNILQINASSGTAAGSCLAPVDVPAVQAGDLTQVLLWSDNLKSWKFNPFCYLSTSHMAWSSATRAEIPGGSPATHPVSEVCAFTRGRRSISYSPEPPAKQSGQVRPSQPWSWSRRWRFSCPQETCDMQNPELQRRKIPCFPEEYLVPSHSCHQCALACWIQLRIAPESQKESCFHFGKAPDDQQGLF